MTDGMVRKWVWQFNNAQTMGLIVDNDLVEKVNKKSVTDNSV